eukprot:TRINITY_DN1580_c0_g1_i3.p1 TRINITY_DN1580_c0_g1~~TRINITY_DN1580_c0_g1_i3.p1  ORF type:complete len:528 (+),score=82.69 TRINITY_DN1580_c0_g1_i3:18-1601(+)
MSTLYLSSFNFLVLFLFAQEVATLIDNSLSVCTSSECDLQNYTCPSGSNCTWRCEGFASCLGSSFTCEPGSYCRVECTGRQSCNSMNVTCQQSESCVNYCKEDEYTCFNAYVLCFSDKGCGQICEDWTCSQAQCMTSSSSYNCTQYCAPFACSDIIIDGSISIQDILKILRQAFLQQISRLIRDFYENGYPIIRNGVITLNGYPQLLVDPKKIPSDPLLRQEMFTNIETRMMTLLYDTYNKTATAKIFKYTEDVYVLQYDLSEILTIKLNRYFTETFNVGSSKQLGFEFINVTVDMNEGNMTFESYFHKTTANTIIIELLVNQLFPQVIAAFLPFSPADLTATWTHYNDGSNMSYVFGYVNLSCTLPQPFWDGIVCSNGVWRSATELTANSTDVRYPDVVNSSSLVIHTGNIMLHNNITVVSSMFVNGNLSFDQSSSLSLSNDAPPISVSGCVGLHGILRLKLNETVNDSSTYSKEVNLLETGCSEGSFSGIIVTDANGTEVKNLCTTTKKYKSVISVALGQCIGSI